MVLTDSDSERPFTIKRHCNRYGSRFVYLYDIIRVASKIVGWRIKRLDH